MGHVVRKCTRGSSKIEDEKSQHILRETIAIVDNRQNEMSRNQPAMLVKNRKKERKIDRKREKNTCARKPH